ncbi:MAG: antibiotic biosynthesis monooxygenase [Chloroflexota bacterium]|nr:antibiotic biosynthesis monooxygenase [Dehalococcoidia bacterium]MDW8252919.1 antibiotic biosynthesis monooxygenase [Chloroflexota bacterium]
MYVVYVEVIDKSDDGGAWERWKRREGAMMHRAPGWRKRLLLRSKEEPRRFHYITFWETAEQAIAFSTSEEFKQAAAALGITDLVTRIRFEECDVILDEAAGLAAT